MRHSGQGLGGWVPRGVDATSAQGWIVVGLFLAVLVAPAQAGAQEEPDTRVLTVVDHVSGSEIYLAAGSDHGIQEGDTLSVYEGEGEGAEFLGTLTIQSATERRSVASFAGPPFPVSADLMYLGLPRALAEARAAERAQEAEVAAAVSVGAEQNPEPDPDPAQQVVPRPPIKIRGRVSLDMDALQTTTRWGESAAEEATRTFSTPTVRLQARKPRSQIAQTGHRRPGYGSLHNKSPCPR